MASFAEQRKKDLEALQIMEKEHPELFVRRRFNEDKTLLESIGITIPNKENQPHVLLKIFPSDFIVEEIDAKGNQTTISRQDDGYCSDSEGTHTHATLVKCGLSTFDVVQELSQKIGVPVAHVTYAGIKDKWAITSQRIAIPTEYLEKADIALKDAATDRFFFKDIVTAKGQITTGNLTGNRFSIFLRADTSAEKEKFSIAADTLSSFAKNGIYNYFYLQRFRAPRYTNYHWGYLVLQGEYKKAVELYLTEVTGRESPFIEMLRNEAKNHLTDFKKLYEIFSQYPSFFETEEVLTRYLKEKPGDYKGGLLAIESQVQMWLYALTSFLFNEKVGSFVRGGMRPPEVLPIVFSYDKEDWLPYIDLLERHKLFPPPLQNIRMFRGVQIKRRTVKTIEKVDLQDLTITSHGAHIRFALGKGQYATTFLSHAFTLANDVPRDFTKEKPETLAKYQDTFDYFMSVNFARGGDNSFTADSE